jgi:hypothetical protein
MSELSTVAIKDGHRGHFPNQRNPAEAERADRISRLAGELLSVAATPSALPQAVRTTRRQATSTPTTNPRSSANAAQLVVPAQLAL